MRPPVARRAVSVAIAAGLAVTLAAVAPLPQDRGASGAWQKLLKLRTIASVMHTTAHPDDEHGGLLAMLSRGEGARVSLLTLTRGEAGDNAIGPELFDPLGLIRTEELLRADQYYGVDQQYFTTAIDYGFSKRLEEALVKWGRDNILRDVVRVIRMERPLVLIARFQGNDRDGHGNHQAAGLITQDAWRVAGDAAVFPEQLREGLRPWQPLKLYMGGVRENEDWTIRVDPAVYSPWLGDSYANFARTGLSFQRSQNSGRNDPQPGPAYAYYKRLASRVDAPAKETSFFDAIDTHITGLFAAVQHPPPAGGAAALQSIQKEVDAAVAAFKLDDPGAAVPALARGLTATRRAIPFVAQDPDAAQMLRTKEQQFADAIHAALGIDFAAIAQPPGSQASTSPFAPAPTLEPVVPGETFDVNLRLTNRGAAPIELVELGVVHETVGQSTVGTTLERDQTATRVASVAVPPLQPGRNAGAAYTRPYFSRTGIAQNRYDIGDLRLTARPSAPAPFVATARYRVGGVTVDATTPVMRRELRPPYGSVMRELAVVPAIAVNVSPRRAIVAESAADRRIQIRVDVLNNARAGNRGDIVLRLPDGWSASPVSASFVFSRAGEKASFQFAVTPSAVGTREYLVQPVATVDGHEYKEGYDVIEHSDLETRYLYHDAVIRVRGVDVKIAPGLKVGYVMGAGDDVPAAITELGADVRLLEEKDVAAGDLSRFDVIMTGTRAYGAREDLRSHNRRLLEYVRNGGNLIVLYNTPNEFDPAVFAPFPAQLPANAEEVSEEDSLVEILAPSRPEFTTPNRITQTDFDGWVEQRGSKFFSAWDPAYTPMIATHDQGQPPQRGGWVTATYGKGHYTYFAYAFHRQLPYGIPGAYRLLANLLSLGK
jgi:LmbE family N-acetylglucosaminyl deacetylase